MKTKANPLDSFRAAVDNLDAFRNAHRSHSGRRIGGPPTTREAWASCVSWLARMARESDALAQLAAGIGLPPLYQTDGEAAAAIYRAALVVLYKDYDDVIGRSMPDAGRPSAYRKEWTRAEKILALAYLKRATHGFNCTAPGYGWALEALAREERVFLPNWKDQRGALAVARARRRRIARGCLRRPQGAGGEGRA